jgi:hypothetical protein
VLPLLEKMNPHIDFKNFLKNDVKYESDLNHFFLIHKPKYTRKNIKTSGIIYEYEDKFI